MVPKQARDINKDSFSSWGSLILNHSGNNSPNLYQQHLLSRNYLNSLLWSLLNLIRSGKAIVSSIWSQITAAPVNGSFLLPFLFLFTWFQPSRTQKPQLAGSGRINECAKERKKEPVKTIACHKLWASSLKETRAPVPHVGRKDVNVK